MVWDTPSSKHNHTMDGMLRAAMCIAFSPDGKRIVTGNTRYIATISDAGNGKDSLY